MQFVEKVGRAIYSVSEFYRDINPSTLTGAIDVIVIEDVHTGYLSCTPFHVRFGKLKLLRPQEKIVEMVVNNVKVDLQMKLGEAGESFFVIESDEPVSPEYATSPLIKPQPSNESHMSKIQLPQLEYKSNERLSEYPLSDSEIDYSSRNKKDQGRDFIEPLSDTEVEMKTVASTPSSPPTSLFESNVSSNKDEISVPQSPSSSWSWGWGSLPVKKPLVDSTKPIMIPATPSIQKNHLEDKEQGEALVKKSSWRYWWSRSESTASAASSFSEKATSNPELENPIPSDVTSAETSSSPKALKESTELSATINHTTELAHLDMNISKQPLEATNPVSTEIRELTISESHSQVETTNIESSLQNHHESSNTHLVIKGATMNDDKSQGKNVFMARDFEETPDLIHYPLLHDENIRETNTLGPLLPETINSHLIYEESKLIVDTVNQPTVEKESILLTIDDKISRDQNFSHTSAGLLAEPLISSPFPLEDKLAQQEPINPLTSTVEPNVEPNSNPKYYLKSLRMTHEQLKSLHLVPGMNTITFNVLGYPRSVTTSHIYLWRSDAKVVISDVDGTITKSDVFGHIFTIVGKDWTHGGVAQLYSKIRSNGYEILYLTSRALGQADYTRVYLKGIEQGQYQLPDGPVIMSPDRLFTAFHREMIVRRPEEFKIACLKDIYRLFLTSVDSLEAPRPFYAGFGNKQTDGLSYKAVHVLNSRIFIINPSGEIRLAQGESKLYKSNYLNLADLVDNIFPPINLAIKDDSYSDLFYWSSRYYDSASDTKSVPKRKSDHTSQTISRSNSNPSINMISDRASSRSSLYLSSDEPLSDNEFSHLSQEKITRLSDSIFKLVLLDDDEEASPMDSTLTKETKEDKEDQSKNIWLENLKAELAAFPKLARPGTTARGEEQESESDDDEPVEYPYI